MDNIFKKTLINRIIRISCKTLVILLFIPMLVYAQDEPNTQNNDSSVRRGGIVSLLLRERQSPFALFPYEENYFIYTITNNLNREAISNHSWAQDTKDREAEFQFSLAIPISYDLAGNDSVLAVAYTQTSWWQILNDDISSPFRESNYQPQIFLGWATDYEILGWSMSEIEAGYHHDSNGESNLNSRSWNRIYLRLIAQKDNWQIDLKPWFLIGKPQDNPDITKYLGYYRLKINYRPGNNLFSLQSHYNWNTGYGNVKLNWSYPIGRNVRFYTQLFSGYGESLIDYNYKQTRYGIGLCLDNNSF